MGKMQRSVEMGDEGDAPILPSDYVGTFSCHGIDSHQKKINQDCACIAHPLEEDEKAALFIVLDGHGSKGHEVSAELLRNLHDKLDGCTWDQDDLENELQLSEAVVEVGKAPLPD
jgi:serine/threonine protein phosphatase PrpC